MYEGKQYKKGLKAAESILKKFPDHGDFSRFLHSEPRWAVSFFAQATCLQFVLLLLRVNQPTTPVFFCAGETLAMKGLTLNCVDKKKEVCVLFPLAVLHLRRQR
eukprot:2034358-Rhodomonas_salina.1